MFAELLEIKPTVPHNISNALAAAGLARTLGVPHEKIREALAEFSPGRHRIEVVAEKDGITWIDDSKATNPHAAQASLLSAFSVIWLAGGMAKGADVSGLVASAHPRIKRAIIFGQDRNLFSQAFAEHAPHIQVIELDPQRITSAVLHRIPSWKRSFAEPTNVQKMEIPCCWLRPVLLWINLYPMPIVAIDLQLPCERR